MIIQITDSEEKQSICQDILTNLPDWFGIPESIAEYSEKSKEMPFWAALDEGKPVGFLVLNATSVAAAEIYVMGILPEYHRRGIGRELYAAFESFSRQEGYRYLHVKTVKMGYYSSYDGTNLFYQALGFSELECFPQLWDVCNPCQIYVKYLRGSYE